MTTELPLWVDAVSAALVVAGALAALVGSLGLVRLRTFFQRVHAPTLGSTVGTWALALATAIQQSFLTERPFFHALPIPVFLALTTPITTIFLMRAAVFRGRVRGEQLPRPMSE